MTTQPNLFADIVDDVPTSMALQTWHLAPPCAFGSPTLAGRPFTVGWNGPHHCVWCALEVRRGCAAFAAAVARGVYDADGYTPAERRAQRRGRLK